MASAFLDSNVLVYAFTRDARWVRATELLEDRPTISVQTLNEFCNVMRRKLGRDWTWLKEVLATINALRLPVVPVTLDTHLEAVRIAERFGYSIFDSLLVASALRANCDTFWSEDLQHGMVIDGRLRIANPFRMKID